LAELQITHRDLFGPAFYRPFNDFMDCRYTTQIFAGGRYSMKSSFISLCIVIGMILHKDAHAIIYRKIGSDLANSVYTQVEWAIHKLGVADEFEFKKSPLKIVRRKTGQQILFRGLDDPMKSKSLKAPFGYFRFFWAEEFDQYDGIEEIRSVRQSVLRGGHVFQTFYSYNPPETSSNWANYFVSTVEAQDPTTKVYRSDYRSVPRQWISETFLAEAEFLKRTNFRAYCHEYLGMVTGNGGSIFPNVRDMRMSDSFIANFDRLRFGLDWGFARDPAAWVALNYDKTRRDIYIYDEIYGTDLTNLAFAELILKKDMGHAYLSCDSAEPKSIAEFEGLGINAIGVTKGHDSVRFSTRWLQGLPHIYIDQKRCPNAFREFSLYEYEKMVNGQFKSSYPDKNNHAIDAVRYSLMDDAVNAGMF